MSGSLSFRLRRFGLGLRTLIGSAPRGWFIPYRYADDLPDAATRPPYGALEDLFEASMPAFRMTLARVEDVAGDLAAIGPDDAAPGPRWHQDWFPRLDAAVAYAMVRAAVPARIVEVGSGHSTRFMARAVADGALATSITAIDPAPRASIDALPITLHRVPLHEADPAVFGVLEAGDLLFIDSSHILMPGSDVDDLLNRVLPSLPSGVLVHIHDILLPDPYPASWSGRGYNEQQGVAPLLTSGAWQPLFSSHYITSRHPALLETGVLATLPLPEGAHETSLWLVRR
jgi:predicted O-methyltransferase YrrM